MTWSEELLFWGGVLLCGLAIFLMQQATACGPLLYRMMV